MITEGVLPELFRSFGDLHVLVIGDVMCDSYVFGNVDRISPEAPVAVVNMTKKENRLGGAANVALNVKAFGSKVSLAGIIGDDADGVDFKKMLLEKDILGSGILMSNKRPTTTKTRIIGNKHQLLRVDYEVTSDIDSEMAIAFCKGIEHLVNQDKPDVVIIEDYEKGLLNAQTIPLILAICKTNNIPVVVDPKQKNFLLYKEVDLFKPNLKEAREGLNVEINPTQPETLIAADIELRNLLNHKISLITLSENGIFVGDGSRQIHLPAYVRNIADVSGAGDTVISVAALCLAAGTNLKLLATLSNLAGGAVCEKIGVVPVDASQLLDEALRLIRSS